jgi:hypothetical protein
MAIGRISGPLLKQNLIRDGVNLAFETDLLYLDVVNSRIGINSSSPEYALDIVGTARTTDLQVTNQLNVGNFTVTGNTISSTLSTINFVASGDETTAYHSRVTVDDVEIRNNAISTVLNNSNLELRAHGTGIVDIQSSAKVTGNLEVTGNITATGNIQIDGNLIIGDATSDTIQINASLKSSLIPETTNLHDLGSSSFRWRNVYAQGITAENLNLNSFQVGDLSFADNRISTVTNQDLVLSASGTGNIVIGNFAIRGNTITNTVSDAISIIASSGTGYVKISGTNGFVLPRGGSGDRPTSYAVEGMMRYNTDSKAIEIWDGSLWASPSGTSGAVSEGSANDISAAFALMLG